MTITQYASPLPPQLQFASNQAEADYHQRVAQARSRQKAKFAVAPECEVRCRRGLLEAGEAVSVEDFDPAHDERGAVVLNPSERLQRLVRSGVVIERW